MNSTIVKPTTTSAAPTVTTASRTTSATTTTTIRAIINVDGIVYEQKLKYNKNKIDSWSRLCVLCWIRLSINIERLKHSTQ